MSPRAKQWWRDRMFFLSLVSYILFGTYQVGVFSTRMQALDTALAELKSDVHDIRMQIIEEGNRGK